MAGICQAVEGLGELTAEARSTPRKKIILFALGITILESFRGLRKLPRGVETLGFGYSSRQVAKFGNSWLCRFDPFDESQDKLREKSFLAPSHSLGMTGLGPSLCALASLREIFRFSIAALPRWAPAMINLSEIFNLRR
jgi:hypothetical protein